MGKIKDFPQEERPRERLYKMGASALSNSELLALVMGNGYGQKNAVDLSKELLRDLDINTLATAPIRKLRRIKGIGLAKACQIVASFELGRRASTYTKDILPEVTCAEEVYELTKTLSSEKKEHLLGLFLDTRKRLVSRKTIFIGTLDASIIHPREIFKEAVEQSSAAVIIVHNHPSGNPSPSHEDIEVTRQLVHAGRIMGIPVLDHIIIGEKKYESLRKEMTHLF